MRRTQKNAELVRSVVEASSAPMSVFDIIRATQLSEGQARRAVFEAQQKGYLHVVARARAGNKVFANFYAAYAVDQVEFLKFAPQKRKTTDEIVTRAKELGGHFSVLVAQLEG